MTASVGDPTLFIASGGLGDLLLAGAIADSCAARAVYAAIPWERPSVDPHVGPRPLSKLQGIAKDQFGPRVTRATSAPGCASDLPKIAHALAPSPLYVLDIAGSLSQQIEKLVLLYGVKEISLVDVGGDILATKPSPQVTSPLSEAILISALRYVRNAHKNVIVAGLGLDGELSQSEIEGALNAITTVRLRTISRSVARSWHTRGRGCRTETSLLALLAVLHNSPIRVQVGGPSNGVVEMSEFATRNYSVDFDDLLARGVPGSFLGPTDSITVTQAELVEMGFPDELRYHSEWSEKKYLTDPSLSIEDYITEPYISIRSFSRFASARRPNRDTLARLHRSLSRLDPEFCPVLDRSTAITAYRTLSGVVV